MASHKQIVEACWPILDEVGHHLPQTINQRRFVTAYQVWFRLRERQAPICQMLIDECGGEFVGKDAGKRAGIEDGPHDGPVLRIARALGSCADIETQYLDVESGEMTFKGFEPAGPDCGLFRIKS